MVSHPCVKKSMDVCSDRQKKDCDRLHKCDCWVTDIFKESENDNSRDKGPKKGLEEDKIEADTKRSEVIKLKGWHFTTAIFAWPCPVKYWNDYFSLNQINQLCNQQKYYWHKCSQSIDWNHFQAKVTRIVRICCFSVCYVRQCINLG